MKVKYLSLCLVCMLLFQNCDSFVDESDLASLDEALQNRADQLPFAFESSVDEIAYMSCKGDDFYISGEPYFSFKAGGYGDGTGVKLKESFLEEWGGISIGKLIQYLGLSDRNANAGVVMSVRESQNFQNTLEYGGKDDATVYDAQIGGLLYSPLELQGHLTADAVSRALLDKKGESINYFKGLSGLKKRAFETEIRLDQEGGTDSDESFRNDLQDSAYLSFTYSQSDLSLTQGHGARSPFGDNGGVDSARSVWGKGYQFNFSQFSSVRPSSPKRAVGSVLGYNLENESSLGEQWECPADEKYIVVRPGDALRRYDGVALDPNNHPFHSLDNDADVPTDPDYDGPATAPYIDGGFATGGYYYSFLSAEEDPNQQIASLRRKVICPTVPDHMLIGETEHVDPAWVRIRNILSPHDWYVFRGPKYNCVVPKYNADSCYGDVQKQQSTDNTGTVQYFANEDFPSERLKARRENPLNTTEIVVKRDCGGVGQNFCPHILSVCYKRN